MHNNSLACQKTRTMLTRKPNVSLLYVLPISFAHHESWRVTRKMIATPSWKLSIHVTSLYYKQVSFIYIGGDEFITTTTPKLNSRFPQSTMTNDPEKVWPGGIVHYVMDTSLGKFLIAYPTCSILVKDWTWLHGMCVKITNTNMHTQSKMNKVFNPLYSIRATIKHVY